PSTWPSAQCLGVPKTNRTALEVPPAGVPVVRKKEPVATRSWPSGSRPVSSALGLVAVDAEIARRVILQPVRAGERQGRERGSGHESARGGGDPEREARDALPPELWQPQEMAEHVQAEGAGPDEKARLVQADERAVPLVEHEQHHA